MTSTVFNRIVRREMHSPRTVATVLVLIIVALLAIYVGIEITLHLSGIDPLLVTPGAALIWLTGLPAAEPAALIVAGAALAAVVGFVLIWLALTPGHRAKHHMRGFSHAIVADNGVIASSIAEHVRRELDLSKGAVVVGIGHRSADVSVRPEPGQVVEKDHVRAVAESELARYELSPRVKARARVLHAADVEEMS